MGSALGIAVFGAIANAELRERLGAAVSATAAEIPASALEPAVQEVFLGSLVVAVVLVLAIAAMPRMSAPLDPETADPDS
jgi:hypothetical protein